MKAPSTAELQDIKEELESWVIYGPRAKLLLDQLKTLKVTSNFCSQLPRLVERYVHHPQELVAQQARGILEDWKEVRTVKRASEPPGSDDDSDVPSRVRRKKEKERKVEKDEDEESVEFVKEAPAGWSMKQAFVQFRGRRERFWNFTLPRPFGNSSWFLQVRVAETSLKSEKTQKSKGSKGSKDQKSQKSKGSGTLELSEIQELLQRMAFDLGALPSEDALGEEKLRALQRLQRLEQRFTGPGVTEAEARNALRLFERELSKANWTEEKFAKLKRQLAGTEEWSAADVVVECSLKWVQEGKRRQAWFTSASERMATPLGIEFGYTSNGGCCFVGPLSAALGAGLTTALVCHLGHLDLKKHTEKTKRISAPQFLQGFVILYTDSLSQCLAYRDDHAELPSQADRVIPRIQNHEPPVWRSCRAMDQSASIPSCWLRCPWTPGFNVLLKFCQRPSTRHLLWYLPHVEDYRTDQLSHLGDVVYLDYAGAALFSRAQLAATQELLLQSCLGNPHSSSSSQEALERSRDLVLQLFNGSRKTHSVIFTSGATQSLQLVGEHFPWRSGGCFLYADESHTSVLGLRQFARASKCAFGTLAMNDLPSLSKDLSVAQIIEGDATEPIGAKLLAIPGESNFSGLKTDLSCLFQLRKQKWRILLDAAKLACSPGALDLNTSCADFTVVSFYKIFGYPTGLGALLVRHDAAPVLQPAEATYFAGGTVSSISARSSFVVPKPSLSEWLERGTPHFQGILSLPAQVSEVSRLGSPWARRHHALALCREAYLRTAAARHGNGRRLSRVVGAHEHPEWETMQGPTLALLLYYADGSPVPYGLVAKEAAERQVMLRTGCHCNAGACQRYLGLTDEDIRGFYATGKVCGDDRGVIDGRATGVVRLSFGLYSTFSDVDRWMEILMHFVDQLPQQQPSMVVSAVSVPDKWVQMGATGTGTISALKVYPVKGCGALQVKRWPMDGASLFLDRRWCLTLVSRKRPVSAKQAPRLTNVRLSLKQEEKRFVLVLSSKFHPQKLEMLLNAEDSQILLASGVETDDQIDGESSNTVRLDEEEIDSAAASAWFEQLLNIQGLQLLRAAPSRGGGTGEAPETSPAKTDFANAPKTLLMVSTASLKRFGEVCGLGTVPVERFRANLEVSFPEDQAYEEMAWPSGLVVQVGGTDTFEVAGKCVRCQAIDIDPDASDASASNEGPSLLAALATADVGGSTSKGPTFGVLLRKRQQQLEQPEPPELRILEDGALAKERHLVWEKLFEIENGEDAKRFCEEHLRQGFFDDRDGGDAVDSEELRSMLESMFTAAGAAPGPSGPSVASHVRAGPQVGSSEPSQPFAPFSGKAHRLDEEEPQEPREEKKSWALTFASNLEVARLSRTRSREEAKSKVLRHVCPNMDLPLDLQRPGGEGNQDGHLQLHQRPKCGREEEAPDRESFRHGEDEVSQRCPIGDHELRWYAPDWANGWSNKKWVDQMGSAGVLHQAFLGNELWLRRMMKDANENARNATLHSASCCGQCPSSRMGLGISLCPAEISSNLSFESRFQIDEGNVLGTGKFSTVYLCFRRGQPNRRFALKAISTYIGDNASLQRIYEEIAIMRVIEHHQSIIRLIEMDESTPNTIRLVLELCEGGELYDRIQQKKFYSEADTKLLIKNLLEAVAYIHSKGIMHRDLKPENILLVSKVSNTDIKVSDFGLAKLSKDYPRRLPRSTSICGSDFYLAPEVIKQELSIEDRHPHGPPTTYGPTAASPPSAVNAFWSEKVKDDVALRGMRPSFLPAQEPEESDRGLEMVATDSRNLSALRVVGSDGTVVGAVDHVQGMTGFSHVDPSSQGGDLGTVLRMILAQNQELARQLVDLRKRVDLGDQVSFPGSGVRSGTGAQGSGEQRSREKGRALEDLTKEMNTKETKDPGVAASPGEAPVVAGGEPSRGAPGKPVDPDPGEAPVVTGGESSRGAPSGETPVVAGGEPSRGTPVPGARLEMVPAGPLLAPDQAAQVSKQLMEMARMRTGAGEMPASSLLSLSPSQIPNLEQVHGQTLGRSRPEGLRSEEINLGAALHQLLSGSVQPTPVQPIPTNPVAFQPIPTNSVAFQPAPIDPGASQPAPAHPGAFQPSPANPAGYQPIHQGGGIGIGSSVGGGCGGPQLGGGLHQDAGLLPSWLKSFATTQESIRTVELAKLPEIKEGEMGSLVVGDWIALISPTMRDLSVSSSRWWDAVLRAATEAYSEWLRAEPLQKLYVVPRNPSQDDVSWGRVEQRGQAMMLSALPETLKAEVLANRATSTVEVLFRIFTRYQPGGLGERSLLLRQLVDGKQFSTVGEMMEHLRNWKRWLRRAVELQITIPDPTLLAGALEKMGATLTQHSSQVSFRLSSARVLLQIDVNPTVQGVTSYADVLLAEAEAAFHSVTQQTTAKVKALEVGNQSKGGLTGGGAVGEVKKAAGVTATPTRQIPCRFFASDEGCKKGSECTFKHDWGGVEKQGRCFNCGSTQHSKRDCPVKSRKGGDANKAVKAIAGDKTGGGSKGQDDVKGRSSEPAVASMKKEVKVEETTAVEKNPERVKKEEDPVKELLQETAGLLRSLRGPTLKKIMLNSLEVRDQRALLDGGATHCLRQAGSESEWQNAKEVTVQLAQGSTVLRQKSWSRTLLTQDAVQPIVPLGVLVELCGYAVRWEGSSFELTDQSGRILDTTLEGGCPTVEEELGLELIKEIETAMIRQKARLNVLRGEDLSMDHEELVGTEMMEFLRLLKEVFPTTPEEVLERVPAKSTWKGEDLPWNRRKRRRLRCAKEIVIHLFSGGDPGFWEKELAATGREVLCVDLAIHKDQDLRNDAIMAYLQYLCQLGTVAVIMGGPPCRSVSRLRHTQPGPPPLRSRFGPERFGLHHLEPWRQRRVNEDTNLWMRQLFLYMIAQRSATRLVAFVKESPQDPETYAPTPDGQEQVPSFWAFVAPLQRGLWH
eukprot:s294_g20.t1